MEVILRARRSPVEIHGIPKEIHELAKKVEK